MNRLFGYFAPLYLIDLFFASFKMLASPFVPFVAPAASVVAFLVIDPLRKVYRDSYKTHGLSLLTPADRRPIIA